MGTRKQKHVHVHKIMKSGPIWKCVNRDEMDCAYFVYFKQQYVMIGRASICWQCGKIFQITEETLSEDTLRCDSCRNPEILTVDIDDLIAERTK